MASFMDILAPSRVPDDTGVARRRGPADLESSVRHDLQVLLNTRCPPGWLTADSPELKASVLNYGLKDFAFTRVMSAADRQAVAEHIAETIRAFEPRLTDVQVEARDPEEVERASGQEAVGRLRLYFHISARLVGSGGATETAFENRFEWTSGHHEVTPT